jgi:cytoskeletal protein CcmA (bactofilin family)
MRDDSLYSNEDLIGNTDSQRSDMQKTLLTIKGNSAKIEGKLIISNSIEIDCEITGELNVDGKLIIQQSGHVNADVKTSDAIINGVYEGNMEASGNVQITETGKTSGNIKTDSLIIEKGGIFAGNVERITELSSDKK